MAFCCKQLPAELMTDILSRLPQKSLVECRAVAKPWLNFIVFSRFPYWLLELHISCDPQIPCPHNQSRLILTFDSHGYIERRHECKLLTMGGGSKENNFKLATEIRSPVIQGKTSFQIKTACCNGLICLSVDNDDSLVLWNPSIGDHKTLPVPSDSVLRHHVCGLGFDPTTDDYKVVSIFDKKAIHVFSVKENQWKNIGVNLPYSVFNEGIPANGCIYWSASKNYKFGDVIIRLRLSDYSLTEISQPEYDLSILRPDWKQDGANYTVIAELNVIAWGNSLGLYRQFDQSIWVMREEKDEGTGEIKEIWTHKLTLPKISYQDSQYRYHYRLQPRCFTKCGRLVVFVKHKRYVLFDGKGYYDLNVQGLLDGFHSSVVYTDSMISPHSIRSMEDID